MIILTALIRKSIRTAPLHGFTAPKMSSGKSLLADVEGLIATGKVNCAISHAENEAEEKKRLLAVLSEGDPEERTFVKNLYKYIPQNRGALVVAALTMLRAYHMAGRPKAGIVPFGSFEEWSDFVRSAIVWLDQEDPCKSRKEIENADPIRVTLGCLLSSWYAVYGDFSRRIRDVLIDVEDKDKKITDEMKKLNLNALHEALMEIAPDNKGGINSKSLGKKLSSFKGRIENGFRLENAGIYQGAETWRVIRIV